MPGKMQNKRKMRGRISDDAQRDSQNFDIDLVVYVKSTVLFLLSKKTVLLEFFYNGFKNHG